MDHGPGALRGEEGATAGQLRPVENKAETDTRFPKTGIPKKSIPGLSFAPDGV